MTLTTTGVTSFNFMKLPAEIRGLIYSFALIAPGPIDLHACYSNTVDATELRLSLAAGYGQDSEIIQSVGGAVTKTHLNPAILCVCRFVYEESRLILYGRNVFTVSADNAFRSLTLLTPSRNFVQHLRLELFKEHDLMVQFSLLARRYLRYFRGLVDLVLVFPEVLSPEYWDMMLGRKIFSPKVYHGKELARGNLASAVDWLPSRTKVTLCNADLDQDIVWQREQCIRDDEIEAAVQRMRATHQGKLQQT